MHLSHLSASIFTHVLACPLGTALPAPQIASMARTDCALAELALMDNQAQAALLQLSESRGHLLSTVQLRLVRSAGG